MRKKIVIACDSFKGCLGSGEVASAVAEGIRRVIPDVEIIISETADGGEGTGGILTKSMGGETVTVCVNDPLGRLINAQYGIISTDISSVKTAGEATEKATGKATEESEGVTGKASGKATTAIIEMAQASGLTLLSKEERNPLLTSTYGTGEMILDAFSKGCRKFLIGIGGSATNDGGTGMLEALGFRFLDKNGKEIKGCCGGRLGEIADIDSKLVSQEILDSEFIIACDVTTPFCGEEGATHVFASQKGADEEAIETLEKGMQSFAQVINNKYDINLNDIPGSGAAGGLGGAFKAFLNADLKSGIDMILDAAGFDDIIEGATLVITGEGKIDFQSSKGKVIDGICKRCMTKNIPVLAIAGIVDDNTDNHSTSTTRTSPTEISSRNNSNPLLTIRAIGPRPQNESDLEYAMRPEVARKNISDTILKILPEFL